MPTDFEILRNIYNSFDPFEPLPAGDPVYVNCSQVRGEENILVDVGRQITYADRITHQLYTGHRGAGKSTELLRLQANLEENGYRVVYFAAEESDIDPEDVQYTDILLACTRNLLNALKGDEIPIKSWLRSRKTELIDALQSEMPLGDDIDVDLPFTKLTTTLKVSPTSRAQIRKIVEPHTPSLIDALNTFIKEAMAQTPQKTTEKLVLIVDSLDRIPPNYHEQIFVDRGKQLKMLDCHVIYTVPISLVYSIHSADLRDIYDAEIPVLPMVMVRDQAGNVYDSGLEAMHDLVRQRVFDDNGLADTMQLVGDVFDTQETLDQMCLMSGGHIRNLMQMAQEAIKQSDTLPITKRAARLAVTKARSVYRNVVNDDQWALLATVHKTKEILNDETYRNLLFSRCILEYRYLDDDNEIICWRDVHPLLLGVKEFQAALEESKSANQQENKRREKTFYRFYLSDKSSIEEQADYYKKIESLKRDNPDWKFVEDKPREGEIAALLIFNKENEY